MNRIYKERFCIVVVTYNRPEALSRLLKSLSNAVYDENVDLIISIDYSGENSCYEIAKNFDWVYGEKEILLYSENLGLRKHILKCGELSNFYKAICVFEDDLFVSPEFFNFTKSAFYKYKDDDRIGGISLYSHKINYLANRPFVPSFEGDDVFFMCQAQSWGQVWYSKEWNKFYDWYCKQDNELLSDNTFPTKIAKWPKSSWLKFHMKYLVEKNLFFVYPYTSYSTNFTELGTHAKFKSTEFQVSLCHKFSGIYRLPTFNLSKVVCYDIYFENLNIANILGFSDADLSVDLYGVKSFEASFSERFLLTSRYLDFKILKSFNLELKPHENNIIFNMEGKELFLYDTKSTKKNPKANFNDKFSRLKYFYGDLGGRELKMLVQGFIIRFISRFL